MFSVFKDKNESPRILTVSQGDKKRWRWSAEIGEEYFGNSGPYGFDTPKEAIKKALSNLKGNWTVIVVPDED